jgi:hypothetical protein
LLAERDDRGGHTAPISGRKVDAQEAVADHVLDAAGAAPDLGMAEDRYLPDRARLKPPLEVSGPGIDDAPEVRDALLAVLGPPDAADPMDDRRGELMIEILRPLMAEVAERSALPDVVDDLAHGVRRVAPVPRGDGRGDADDDLQRLRIARL